jgi:hypothetical protein
MPQNGLMVMIVDRIPKEIIVKNTATCSRMMVIPSLKLVAPVKADTK